MRNTCMIIHKLCTDLGEDKGEPAFGTDDHAG